MGVTSSMSENNDLRDSIRSYFNNSDHPQRMNDIINLILVSQGARVAAMIEDYERAYTPHKDFVDKLIKNTICVQKG